MPGRTITAIFVTSRSDGCKAVRIDMTHQERDRSYEDSLSRLFRHLAPVLGSRPRCSA